MTEEWFQPWFEYLYALDGGVTLMFVIDTTGSMGNDIKTAVKISRQIIDMPRDDEVDYILSGFDDPTASAASCKLKILLYN